MMKKQEIIIIATICIWAILFVCSACHQTRPPSSIKTETKNQSSLCINPNIINFGTIHTETKQISKYVNIENKGDKPIAIGNIDVSCSCLKFITPTNVILPRKTIKAQIIIDPTNKRGAFNKAIFINSTANNSIEILRVKANIIKS